MVSIEERINDLILRMNSSLKTTFSSLKISQDKSELVVLFLAVLHLVKEKIINVYQEGIFHEMEIKKEKN